MDYINNLPEESSRLPGMVLLRSCLTTLMLLHFAFKKHWSPETRRLFVSAICRDSQGEDNHDIRIPFVGRPAPERPFRKPKGCYRHRWSEGDGPRDGEKADRKGLSRGCELSEHYVSYDAPQHSRRTCREHGVAAGGGGRRRERGENAFKFPILREGVGGVDSA